MTISVSTIHTNGVDLTVYECGDRSNPTVIFSHGFPELGHSWRHQCEPKIGRAHV